MLIRSVALGELRTNCYVLIDEQTNTCLVIDPADDAERLIRLFTKDNLRPVAILLTHGHFDHIYGVTELANHFRLPIIAGEKEVELLGDPVLNESASYGRQVTVVPTHVVGDGEDLTANGFNCKVLETPGHTVGSVCYYFEEAGVAFTGDTIFFESVGRSDFHTGNGDKLVTSIKEKLFNLPKKTVLYPGHGPKTTVEYEIKNNPYILT